MHNMPLSLMFVDVPWKCSVTLPGRERMPGISHNHPRHWSIGHQPCASHPVAPQRCGINQEARDERNIHHEAVLDCVAWPIRGMGLEGCTARGKQQKTTRVGCKAEVVRRSNAWKPPRTTQPMEASTRESFHNQKQEWKTTGIQRSRWSCLLVAS